MTYVVPRPSGSWELRRSVTTPEGPRSRTLASFRVLTDEVVEAAIGRAPGELRAGEIIDAARRAGAPVAREPAVEAAAALLGELARGTVLPRRWRRLLVELLDGDGDQPTDAEIAAAAWADATLAQRGEALRELLLLSDRIDSPAKPPSRRFPRLATERG